MINETTYYYLYSSLLQSQAAILSLLSIFIVLRIQNIKQDIEYCKNYLNSAEAVNKFQKMTNEEQVKYIVDEYNRLTQNNHSTTKIDILRKWMGNDEEIVVIKKNTKVIMYWLIVGMGIDCVSILFSTMLSKSTLIGLSCAILIIALFVYSLIKVVKTSIKMI